MNIHQLCKSINLPQKVIREVENYCNERKSVLDEMLKQRLLNAASWDKAIEEIKRRIGEDKHGFYMLAELLLVACDTYKRYQERGIKDEIFVRTMAFCTRFINRHKELYGGYAFEWGWWFPRQLAMREFRIGELEFEFTESDEKRIYIHIPSDADMRRSVLNKTFHAFQDFVNGFYPDWAGADWYCDSWMLSPALEKLLDESSNVLAFNRLFEVESWEEDSMAVLDWVFPAEKCELKDLSENTSLQRKMKAYLLSGGKVGWAKGKLQKQKIFK